MIEKKHEHPLEWLGQEKPKVDEIAKPVGQTAEPTSQQVEQLKTHLSGHKETEPGHPNIVGSVITLVITAFMAYVGWKIIGIFLDNKQLTAALGSSDTFITSFNTNVTQLYSLFGGLIPIMIMGFVVAALYGFIWGFWAD
jgi:hypothetical protein